VASVRYVSNNIDGYTESSSDAWMRQEVDDVNYDSLQTSLGWRFAYRADFETVSLLPEARISWNHEFLGTDEDFDAKLAMAGADAYTCTIADTGDDYMSVGAGLTMMLGEVSTISLDYDMQFLRDDADPVHSVNAMFRTRF
ncbi:MAG: autotransporter outer membrane beta-barrel domain-containing protein, partial [Opitutales bacterium]|nr:autotransporter outer membrane beta-barrel domain-containing protein [Opitutales bacterium]